MSSDESVGVIQKRNRKHYKRLQELLSKPDHPKSFKEIGDIIGKPRTVVMRWITNPQFLGIDTSDWFVLTGKKPTNLSPPDNYYQASDAARAKWDRVAGEYALALDSGDKKKIDAAYKEKRKADSKVHSSARDYRVRLTKAALSEVGEDDIFEQKKRAGRGFNRFAKELVITGYKSWLLKNPSYKQAGLGVGKQASNWWKYLPSDQKNLWFEQVYPVYDHNVNVWNKYSKLGKLAPASELKELHHILPKEFGGRHIPLNTVGLDMPDHRAIHATEYRPIYEMFKSQSSLPYMPFDASDTNLFDKAGRRVEKGFRYLDLLSNSIIGKTGKRLLGPASAILAGNAAWNYLNEGHPLRALYAAGSVAPGPVGWASYGLEEMSNILDNPVMPEDIGMDEEPYSGMGNQQSLLGYGHSGFQDRRRKNIWN